MRKTAASPRHSPAFLALTVLGVTCAVSTSVHGEPQPTKAPVAQKPAQPPQSVPSPIPSNSKQMLLVRAAHWNAASGSLQRFERNSADGGWSAVGEVIPVNLGRNGMAWGRGLHDPQKGITKREGDRRAPAGVYELTTAFGYAAALPQNAHGFPYLQVDSDTVCVEEVRSKDYNQVIPNADPGKGWEKRSVMLRPDGLFRWGVVVRQNAPEPRPGAGSCVFLHVWRGPHEPTAGCTSLAPDRIELLLRWLEPNARPVLVQLPEAAYAKLREPWQLPGPTR